MYNGADSSTHPSGSWRMPNDRSGVVLADAVGAMPHVAEVHRLVAGEEELVRRREHADAPVRALGDERPPSDLQHLREIVEAVLDDVALRADRPCRSS